ncbi:hypothetical protein PMSD_27480 [Paenibacillus macquariensis subsp. defensor]|nr:hypothetical protein PMSD_27480 [Paenibacillus macquariensis subsp. defensor]
MSLRMELITINFKEMYEIEELYKKSFPENERIPIWFLLWRSKKEFIDYIAFYDDEVFVGYAYLITIKNLTFILYLAISSEVRSQGHGTAVLSKIKEYYADNRIILNIEAIDEAANNFEQRLKRKKFYLRNGYRNASFNIIEYGHLYEVLVHGSDVTIEEYRILFKKFTGSVISLFFKPRFLANDHKDNDS